MKTFLTRSEKLRINEINLDLHFEIRNFYSRDKKI